MATAIVGDDEDLGRRVRLHRDRRQGGWGTLEVGDLDEVLKAAVQWDAVLLDSLTLWVSARVLVSDEVGMGVVPETTSGRRFRDVLGLVNQRAAAAAEEVHLCVAGVGVRIK